jgi:hypothetical protein
MNLKHPGAWTSVRPTPHSQGGLACYASQLQSTWGVLAGMLLLLVPRAGGACTACYGQSDSPLAAGMNWGILSLLAFVMCVLGGIAGFFIFLARRSAVVKNLNAPAVGEPADLALVQEKSEMAFVRREERRLTLAEHRRHCRRAWILGHWRRKPSTPPNRIRFSKTS